MIRTGSLLLLIIVAFSSRAQDVNAFVVYFKSKSTLDKTVSLSQKAINRRVKFGIAIDSFDYDVDQENMKALREVAEIKIRYALRWHNAAVVESSLQSLDSILPFDFIKDIAYVGKTAPSSDAERAGFVVPQMRVKNTSVKTKNLSPSDYGAAFIQNAQIGATYLHDRGFDGSGVQVAVFDAGFKNIDKIPAFIRLQGNEKLTLGFDLVDLDNTLTDSDNHGTAVTSCIGSYHPGEFIGSAPNANLVLFRTEKAASEYPLEELNWCKAAELADSMGVDIITSSLGYTQYDDVALSYGHNNLTGTYSYVSLAARTAYNKGIVVLNSAGNEGDGSWRKIGTPADVAEVIAVGAVDINDRIGNFSSRGFNANGDIKPDVCALGVLASVASTNGTYYQGFGTSYATPILSGAVACLLQAHPEKSPQDIVNAIRSSATRSSQPDSSYGYGVARVDIAHHLLSMKVDSKPQILEGSRGVTIYNGSFSEIAYTIYSVKPFLLIFKRKTKEFEGNLSNSHPITHLPIDYGSLNCSKKYTLRVRVENGVDKYDLKRNDLYRCPN